jgi:hypothetical protein
MSPGGCTRVMALTPPIGFRYDEGQSLASTTRDRNKRLARAGGGVQDTAVLRTAVGYGAGRDRTGDLRLAKAALSQLSYSPSRDGGPRCSPRETGGRGAAPRATEGRRAAPRVVGLSGFEPLTSRLSAVRSSQLSYRPVVPPRPHAPRGSLPFQEQRPPREAAAVAP